MTNAQTICRFPGCEKAAKARGLCETHLSRATRGAGAFRKEAEKYLLPSTRGPRAKSPGQRATPAKRTPEASADAAAGKPSKRKSPHAQMDERVVDARIATATELASWMGLKRYPLPIGFLLVDEKSDRRVILDKNGELREATLTIGNVLHGGAAEMEPAVLDT